MQYSYRAGWTDERVGFKITPKTSDFKKIREGLESKVWERAMETRVVSHDRVKQNDT